MTEAENGNEDQLELDPIAELVTALHGTTALRILEMIEAHVHTFMGDTPAGDDVTMLALTRL